jgi:hypothetical protein
MPKDLNFFSTSATASGVTAAGFTKTKAEFVVRAGKELQERSPELV